MSFNDGFSIKPIPFVLPLPGTASMLVSTPDGTGWTASGIVENAVSASVYVIETIETAGNIQGNGAPEDPVALKSNISLTSVTASFNGDGRNVTNITASNISNFTNDVRGQISAGTNITISGGSISTQNNINVTSITASSGNITGDLVVGGRLTAEEYYTEVMSASVIFASGSTKFGNTADDLMQVSGSVSVSGSLTSTATITGLSGSFSRVVTNIDGTATNPVFFWSSDIDTGFYREGSNQFTVTTGGSRRLRVSDTGVQIPNALGVTGSTTLSTVSGTTAQFTSVTASFSGNGRNITSITASNISNFTNDVRGQFTAGTNIAISNGSISTQNDINLTSVTATSFNGSGTNITNITASNIDNFTDDVRAQFTAGTSISIDSGTISAPFVVTSASNGDLLVYNSSSSVWVNDPGERYVYRDMIGPSQITDVSNWGATGFFFGQNDHMARFPSNYIKTRWKVIESDTGEVNEAGPFSTIGDASTFLSSIYDSGQLRIMPYDIVDYTIPVPSTGFGMNSLMRKIFKNSTTVEKNERRFESIRFPFVDNKFNSNNPQWFSRCWEVVHASSQFPTASFDSSYIRCFYKQQTSKNIKKTAGSMPWLGQERTYGSNGNQRHYFDESTATPAIVGTITFSVGACKVIGIDGFAVNGTSVVDDAGFKKFQKLHSLTATAVHAFGLTDITNADYRAILLKDLALDTLVISTQPNEYVSKGYSVEAVVENAKDGQRCLYTNLSIENPFSSGNGYNTIRLSLNNIFVKYEEGVTIKFRYRDPTTNKVSRFFPFFLEVVKYKSVYALKTRSNYF